MFYVNLRENANATAHRRMTILCRLWTPHVGAAYAPLHSMRPADDPSVRNDLSRTGLYTFVYDACSLQMYCQNKVNMLLLLVLITSYCVRVFYILVTPTWCPSTWLAWSHDHVSLSGCVTLAAWHVTGRLTCLADSLARRRAMQRSLPRHSD